jgi:hypothetical protein
MMIYELYKQFPSLAVYFLHNYIGYGIGNNLGSSMGCWRDMKYLCNYIRKNSNKKEKHGLIQHCISLMNSQLKKDIDNFECGSHISNVSKWIPREHKQFHWLYNMLVIDFTKTHLNWLYSDNFNSKSMLKAKTIYRHRITTLNRELDTTEIKQCSRNWDFINPENISCYTLMKQRSLVFGKSEKYSSCSKNIREHFGNDIKNKKKITKNNLFSKDGFSNFYPISFFVKEAMRICACSSTDEKQLLNKQWQMFSNSIPKNGFDSILPIIDATYYMQLNDSESFYTAIGFAILIAERSTFGKRILFVDYQSTWVNFDSDVDFTDIIENIQNCTISKTNTILDIDSAMELIVYSLIQSKSNNRYIENMKLVFFSCFHGIDTMVPFKKMFSKYGLSLPFFMFWNLAKQEIIPSFFDIEIDKKTFVISGTSNGGIYTLHDLIMFIKQLKKSNGTPFNSSANLVMNDELSLYNHVKYVLNNKRYNILEDYLYNI